MVKWLKGYISLLELEQEGRKKEKNMSGIRGLSASPVSVIPKPKASKQEGEG
jgi:hypothetical protein